MSSLQRFWTDWQNVFANVPSVVALNTCGHYRTYFVNTLSDSDVLVLKFHVWEYGMPFALETNSNGGFKWEPVESSSSNTKNMSPLLQFLWMLFATKLGRIVTCYEGLPLIKSHNPVICGHVRSCDNLKTSPPSECPWSPNLSEWWHNMRSSHP